MDLAEYRQSSQDIWEQMAAGWDRRRQWLWDITHAVGEWMVDRLDPQPGQTVLELAAGPGETGFAAAARLGADGRLISTDFAPAMVDSARRRAQELGLENVEFRVMDAERMELEDDSVDGVLCRWGYMLMADPATAFSETRRVLREGGRLSFSVWGPAERNPWAALGGGTLVALGHMPMPEHSQPGIFALGSEERIAELATGAGFTRVEVEPIELQYRFDDFEDYWSFLRDLAGGVAITLEKLTDEQVAEVHDKIEENATAFRTNGGYVMSGVALNAVAS